MGFDFIKQSVESFLDKKKANAEAQGELEQGMESYQAALEQIHGLDDTIRERVTDVGRELWEGQEALEQERAALETERGGIVKEIESTLEGLMIAKGKLDVASVGRYGDALAPARRACEHCIKEYKMLLEQIDLEKSWESSGDNSAIQTHIQAEKARLQELQIKTEAVGMLVVITQEQKKAVWAYTSEDGSNSYKIVNPALRGQSSMQDLNEESRETIKHLHSLLSNCATKNPITVFRGVRNRTRMVEGGKRLDEYSDNALVGKLLVDGAFVSTSLSEARAFGAYGTILVLSLPKGTCGSYVGDISAAGSGEEEFLMDHTQAFRVTKVERRGSMRYIYADSQRTKTEE